MRLDGRTTNTRVTIYFTWFSWGTHPAAKFKKWILSMFSVRFRPFIPTLLYCLIYHFDPCSTTTTFDAYRLATGLVIGTLVQSVVARHTIFASRELGMRLRIACSSLIFRKVNHLFFSQQKLYTSNRIALWFPADEVVEFLERPWHPGSGHKSPVKRRL